MIFAQVVHAQYFQFSQYDFTPQRVNPAIIGNSSFATMRLLYRNQSTAAGFHLTSSNLDGTFPLINKRGIRWGGLGISFMDDRSGYAGIYNTQEFTVSYAVNVKVQRYQTISLGAKGLYQKRRIDLDGLYTGSQYVEDRGFNQDIYSGENTGNILRNNFMTLSLGMYWKKENKAGEKLAYAGFSFFDFNQPDDSFVGMTTEMKSSYAGLVGFELWRKDNLRLIPEVLLSGSASRMTINGGMITRYHLASTDEFDQHIDLITRYRVGRSGIVGFAAQRKKLAISFTYDFPVGPNNIANTGAFEVGVQLRELITHKKRSSVSPGPFLLRNKVHKAGTVKMTAHVDTLRYSGEKRHQKVQPQEKEVNKLSERLKQKQDSLTRIGYAGDLKHEPLVLERATLYFNFDFGSTELNGDAVTYFNNLAEALVDNPELKIRLTGHTDNVGSDRFNLKLSLERAKAIKNYLVSKGVSAERIIDEGKGMREPLNKNITSADRTENRRVEMIILY
jgi:type IX secretion system PorP/SprF family membrane protein